jgi:RNA polymerase subunit RPABC4/transcription elongation factor Spt4
VTVLFIGGVQPKTTVLDETRRRCPSCGAREARLVRVDKYLSLFFLPVVPIKRGEEVLQCGCCGALSDPYLLSSAFTSPSVEGRITQAPEHCPRCGYSLERQFIYCPQCGQKVRAVCARTGTAPGRDGLL